MPRVSQEYRDRRRQEILDAARRCFIRNGFHQTSMADILAEAGQSAGAVYGHFRSKQEIIVAIAEEVIGQLGQLLEPVVAQDPPPHLNQAVRQGLKATEELAFGAEGFAPLAPQVWAEALRDPQLAAVVRERYLHLHGLVTRLVIAEQRVGRVEPASDPQQVATVLVSVIMGYMLQRLLFGNTDPDSYSAGLAAIVPPH